MADFLKRHLPADDRIDNDDHRDERFRRKKNRATEKSADISATRLSR